MTDDKFLRETLVAFLKGRQTAMNFDDAVKNFPVRDINKKAPNVNYTFWHLLEHIRITQNDILDFSINPDYKYKKAEDYWPRLTAKATKKDWDKTVRAFRKDLKALIKLVEDPKNDLYKPFPWGNGQTLLREAILTAEHNSYHVGELGILRQVVNNWKK